MTERRAERNIIAPRGYDNKFILRSRSFFFFFCGEFLVFFFLVCVVGRCRVFFLKIIHVDYCRLNACII